MTTANSATRTIKVNALARVEGEGGLTVKIKNGAVQDVKFRIFEPPRFFEALLQGRAYSDAPDITARICGICPIAYMLGASQAMEEALGVQISQPVRELRRLIYCGEWIESHVLHSYMLHAPDFLGYPDAIALARDHPALVEKALRLKKLGNQILEVIGGRAVHPVNLRVGGFYRAPAAAEVHGLIESLQRAVDASLETVRWLAGLDYPDYRYDYTCVSLSHPEHYPICEGRIVSNRGLDIAPAEFLDHFDEEHVAHSTALRGRLRGIDSYLVGPIARYNNNAQRLSPLARQAAGEAGLGAVCDNPFHSIIVRAVEILYAFEEALRLAENYREPDPDSIVASVEPGAGIGHGCTEAPRGICYHRYELDPNGDILRARIIPPTSQNQRQIERDLRGVVERNLHLEKNDLTWRCEQTVRNYDPCISCSTHFLTLDFEYD